MWCLELERYAAQDSVGRLRLLVESGSVQTVSSDAARLRAVLRGLPEREWAANLAAALAQEASERLEWCCELFRHEASALKVLFFPQPCSRLLCTNPTKAAIKKVCAAEVDLGETASSLGS